MAVLERFGAHDATKVLIKILAALVVQAVPARRGTGKLVDKGDSHGIGGGVDGLAHKEVEHARGRFCRCVLFLVGLRRFDKIDLVLVAFAGNDKLAPNLAQAVDDDIRRRIQQAVLVVDVEVDEHGIGRCNVQVVAACAKIGALKEQEGVT